MTDALAGEVAVLGRLMLAFRGTRVPGWLEARLAAAPLAGVSLFRHLNVRAPAQVLALTEALQAAARARPEADGRPLLVAADQEGGQLLAFGAGWTPFGGAMALGAAGDVELTERVGRAIGLELRAVGVNIDYAPCLDVASNPGNPSLGIRSFGDDPAAVARLGAAWLRGLQSAGVAGTAKHFPGKGQGAVDTHHELAVVDRSRADLEAVELAPFRAAVAAGARVVMSGHFAIPAITGSRTLPSTLAPAVMTGLLRDELGFDGVAITDALDMGALPQDATQAIDVVAALRAGVDLLLATYRRASHRRIEAAISRAVALGVLDDDSLAASAARLSALRGWIAGFASPPLEVVGCGEHRALAGELAERSITLARDDAGVLPLRMGSDARILVIEPQPFDLTPADTTSTLTPGGLAAALREHHDRVHGLTVSPEPSSAEIAAARDAVRGADLAIVATDAASFRPGQAALARAVIGTGVPVVTVALRTPFDLAGYPEAETHACTFGRLEPSMAAVAAALVGRIPFRGRLPAAVPGLYPTGHGLVRATTVRA
ncbi:MAG: glycoside hydrolase family 3 protein [Chloroflexi bacterium]|nr:glycoside hydrolase family 3 protein [Chloroflexota bacterium]